MRSIEQAILGKIVEAEEQQDVDQLRLANILLANFYTLKSAGLQDNGVDLTPESLSQHYLRNIRHQTERARVYLLAAESEGELVFRYTGILQEKIGAEDLKLGLAPDQIEEFGPVLRLFRRSLDLNQLGSAQKLNYDQSLISKYERGTRVPSPAFLIRLNTVFLSTEEANQIDLG